MTQILGIDYDAGLALFKVNNVAVVVDINKRDVERISDVPRALTASSWMKVAYDFEYPSVWRELAEAAVTDLEVKEKPAEAKAERKFRIPDSVKAEAQQGLDWATGFERGSSAVALSVAKQLVRETYLPISRVRRIATYFSRRPSSITENAGWNPGEQGYPTDERIKDSMWGGNSAREWIAKIEKTHPLTAGADLVEVEAESAPEVDGDGDVDPNMPHEFVDDPDVPGQCLVCGREEVEDIHSMEAIIAAGFVYEENYDYFGKGESPDSTVCTELYRMDENDSWSMYDGTGWVDIDPPTEDTVVIMLDPESAEVLANFIADRDPEAQHIGMELSMIFPEEAAMFVAAEAEIDWGLVDRVFDIYDSQERSINAKKQVRGPGGRFGDVPDDPDAKKQTPQETKARLPQALPLVPDIQARIAQYLADVAKKRGTPLEEKTGGWPGGDTSIEEDPNAEFNWVEDAGGLPKYIKRIEKHLRAKGMTESHAIATAVNAVKKMCATGDINFPGKQEVNVGSRAEACKAVAEWEEKKARASANSSLTADGGPGAVTDVRPLYLAIVDSVDTEAVLDLVSLVPPAPDNPNGYVSCWRRDNGQWVQDNDILASLRGVSPPPVVELTDDTMLTSVIEQVDKATADNEEPQNTEQPTSPEPAKPDANPDQHPVPAGYSNWTWTGGSTTTLNYVGSSSSSSTAATTYNLKWTNSFPDTFEDISSERRDKLAKKGYALPDGSFPIPDVEHLEKAIKAFGRAKDPEAAKRHIKKRARALNRWDLVPSDWKSENNGVNEYAMWGPYGELMDFAGEGGLDRNRGNAEKLRRYWTKGEGAVKIGWGTPGDWSRCVSHLSKYLGTRSKGYCTLRHKDATGFWPGEEPAAGGK